MFFARLHRCHGRRSGGDRGAVATVLQVVWRAIWQFLDAILLAASWIGNGVAPPPRSSPPIPPIGGTRRGRNSRARRQHRRLKSRTRCPTRRTLHALDRVVDLAPCAICPPTSNSFHHRPSRPITHKRLVPVINGQADAWSRVERAQPDLRLFKHFRSRSSSMLVKSQQSDRLPNQRDTHQYPFCCQNRLCAQLGP